MKLSEMTLEQLLAMKAKAEEWIEKKKGGEEDGVVIKLAKLEYEMLCILLDGPELVGDDLDDLLNNYKEVVDHDFDADFAVGVIEKIVAVSDNPVNRGELEGL